MSHRNLHIKACQCRHKGGGRIAVYQHHVRLDLLQHRADGREDLRGHIEQCLPLLHNRQVEFRLYVKGIQNHIQHLPMLAADAYHGSQIIPLFQFFDQRTHLNRFRSGSKHQHDRFHRNPSFLCRIRIHSTLIFPFRQHNSGHRQKFARKLRTKCLTAFCGTQGASSVPDVFPAASDSKAPFFQKSSAPSA